MAEDKNSKKAMDISGTKPIFAWKSPDNVQHERETRWYVTVIVVAVVLAGLLYWQGIWSGIVLVLVAAALFIIMSRVKPKEVTCALYQQGIVVDDKTYTFADFKSFWINFSEVPKAKLQKIGKVAGQVDLPLLNVDGEQVRLFLTKHLPEEEDKGEDLVDLVNRLLRF